MIDIELHVVRIETAVLVVWEDVVILIGEVSERLRAELLPCCGQGGDRVLLVRAAELVYDDDMDLFKVLYECV